MALTRRRSREPRCLRCDARYEPPSANYWRWEDGLIGSPLSCGDCARRVAQQHHDEDRRMHADLRRWAEQLSAQYRGEAVAYVAGLERDMELELTNPPERWRDLGLLHDPIPFPEPGWGHFRDWRQAFGIAPPPSAVRRPRRRGRRRAPRTLVPDLFGLDQEEAT